MSDKFDPKNTLRGGREFDEKIKGLTLSRTLDCLQIAFQALRDCGGFPEGDIPGNSVIAMAAVVAQIFNGTILNDSEAIWLYLERMKSGNEH